MELVWFTLRARFRRAWLPSLAIAMLIGVVGGFVFAAAATARRVDVAYQALLADIDPPDLLVFPRCETSSAIAGCIESPSFSDTEQVTEALSRDGAIEAVRPIAEVRPYLVGTDGTPLLEEADNPSGCSDGDRSLALVGLRAGGPREQSLPFRLRGELPHGDPRGVVLTRATAQRLGLGIGDGVSVAGWCVDDGPVEMSEPIDLVVTGLSIGAFDVEPPGVGQTIEPTYVDQSVLEALYSAGARRSASNAVWLADGSTAARTRELEGYDILLDLAEQTTIIDEALDTDARPLWVLAAAGALTGILLLAPIIDRNIRDDTDDVAKLVALGATGRQIRLRALSHIVVVATVGVLIAVALAPVISAALPQGVAGAILADGRWFDGVVAVLGSVLLLSVVATIAALSTWRLVSGRRTTLPVTQRRAANVVSSLWLGPSAQTGVMAAVGRPVGRRLTSPWPGLVSLIVASTVCVAGLTYLAGLRNLEATPSLLGWNWDAVVFIDDGADDRAAVVAEVGKIDGVEQATSGTLLPPVFLSTPGSDLQVMPWSFATGPGAITPTIVQGRAPEGPDEVAIDLAFRNLFGLGPGDTVQLQRPSLATQVAEQLPHAGEPLDPAQSAPSDGVEPPEQAPLTATFEITGIAVLPSPRTQLFPQVSLTLAGYAAFATPTTDEVEAALAWLPDDLPANVREDIETGLSDLEFTDRTVYVRTSGDNREVVGRLIDLEGVASVRAPSPTEVVTLVNTLNLGATDNVPLALALLTAVAALALVTYLLVTGMWARRRELAVLRALGASSWGVRSSLAAQATCTVVLVAAVAVPVGVAIGQWAWNGYAEDLLAVPEPAIPWLGLIALILGALIVVNAIAMLVAQLDVRSSASRELREE